jgi:hypothetical protein
MKRKLRPFGPNMASCRYCRAEVLVFDGHGPQELITLDARCELPRRHARVACRWRPCPEEGVARVRATFNSESVRVLTLEPYCLSHAVAECTRLTQQQHCTAVEWTRITEKETL